MIKKTQAPVEPLKLVPFNDVWINHATIDIHAIYQRPRFVEDEFGEKHREYADDGSPAWDLTGALPLKQHNRWASKGFRYVTLADRDSLYSAGTKGTIQGNWRQYDQHQTGGPWNYKRYLVGKDLEKSREYEQLEADVRKFGSDVVEHIRKGMDEQFELPDELQNIAADSSKKSSGFNISDAAAEKMVTKGKGA